MMEWLDSVLDAELGAQLEDANSVENIERFLESCEPEKVNVGELIERIEEGTASPDDKIIAKILIAQLSGRATKKERGRPSKPKIERDFYLAVAATTTKRIQKIWNDQYNQKYDVVPMAIEFGSRYALGFKHYEDCGYDCSNNSEFRCNFEFDTSGDCLYKLELHSLIEAVAKTLKNTRAENYACPSVSKTPRIIKAN